MLFHPNIIIVGIGGCSRCGKTTLTKELQYQFNNLSDINPEFIKVSSTMHLDRYFNMAKIRNNQVKTNSGNYYGNWEFPGALDWDEFYSDIKKKIKEMSENIKNSSNKNQKGILFIEGFLLFSPLLSNSNEENNYLNLYDYYIYISLDKSKAKERRMRTTRVPDDYYECILWPEHIKYCSKYVNFLKNQKYWNKKEILILDGNKEYNNKNVALCILKWMNVYTNNLDMYFYNSIFTKFDTQLNLLEKNFNYKI
jgi:uridine kinase